MSLHYDDRCVGACGLITITAWRLSGYHGCTRLIPGLTPSCKYSPRQEVALSGLIQAFLTGITHIWYLNIGWCQKIFTFLQGVVIVLLGNVSAKTRREDDGKSLVDM